MDPNAQTTPQVQPGATPPNPAGAPEPSQVGSQELSGDDFAALVEHPEFAGTGEPTGDPAGSPAPSGPNATPASSEVGAAPEAGQLGEAGSFIPITIKYKGQDHNVDTQDKAQELIQKGLDYTVKMGKLAAHRGNLELLYNVMNDPDRAPKLKALLTGQEVPASAQPEPVAQQQAQPGQPGYDTSMLVPVEGPDGQVVYVQPEPGAVGLVENIVQRALAPLMEKLQANGQAPAPAQENPLVANLVQREMETKVSDFIKETYPGQASWEQAKPKVIDAMLSDGIGPGHPANSDPQTWLNYYMNLGMRGMLPAAVADPNAAPNAGPDGAPATPGLVTTPMPANKSDLKAGAQVPNPNLIQPTETKTEELVNAALQAGATIEQVDTALDTFFDHPDLTD